MVLTGELEKTLRSEKVGEQCESILIFAELLSRFPFPSIIASAFVKLADLYHATRYVLCLLWISEAASDCSKATTSSAIALGGSLQSRLALTRCFFKVKKAQKNPPRRCFFKDSYNRFIQAILAPRR
jgi:hypothetical protein